MYPLYTDGIEGLTVFHIESLIIKVGRFIGTID